MRIIGGRDFYDTAIAFGRDESIIFERNSGRILTAHETHDEYGIPRRQPGFEVHDAESKPRNLGHRLFPLLRRTTQEINLGHTRITCAPQHVLFCGVLYSGMVVTIIKSWPHHQEEHRFWKAEAFRQFCKSHGLAVNDTASSVVKDQRLDGRGLHQQVNVHLESLDDFFTPLPIARDRLGRMIAERITILARIPGGWGRESTWSVNGCELSSMGFAKALDPHSAFQEISMWIGGVLGAENPNIVEITDDRVKAEKHGFHHPTSFRRSKGGK